MDPELGHIEGREVVTREPLLKTLNRGHTTELEHQLLQMAAQASTGETPEEELRATLTHPAEYVNTVTSVWIPALLSS